MLEDKSPIESFHTIVRAHSLSPRGFLEVCDYFDREKDLNNLNLDEKIIIACCLRKIHLASIAGKQKEELDKKRLPAEEFYLEYYDKCAQGTRDYMTAYEEKMQKEREMFKDLDAYVEKVHKKLSAEHEKVYTYKNNRGI